MTIDDLLQIAPAEGVSGGAYSGDEWALAEQKFGIVFPDDYKDLINTYKTGRFGSYLWLLSPFPDVPGWRNMEAFVPGAWDRLRVTRTEFPDFYYNGPLWPDANGLFPWCRDDNGGLICWEANREADPSLWTSVSLDSHYSPAIYTYAFPATDVLYKFLTREITFWDEEDEHPADAADYVPFEVMRGAAGY